MVRGAARAGDGGAVAGGGARAACGLENQARASGVAEVVTAKPAQTGEGFVEWLGRAGSG